MPTNKHKQLEQIDYNSIRSNIQSGDLFFCCGNYSVSRIIRKFTNSEFSHIGFLYWWNNRVLLMESVEDDGVRVVPLSHYLNNYENSGQRYKGDLFIARHLNFPTDETGYNSVLGKGSDFLNRNYDKDALAKIAWRIISGLGRNDHDDEYI
jgi:hypothetical protein